MDAALDWFTDPYEFAFMRRALAALVLVSLVGGVIGAYVVSKGLAFSGNALAHSTLAGVAIAFVSGANVSLGALIAAVTVALGIGFTRRRAGVAYDTAIGILFVAAFALGVLILSRRSSYTPDLFSFVFGDVLGVSNADLLGQLLLTVGLLLFVLAFYRELLMVAYDPAMAATAGVPAAFFEYALLVLIAVAVVVALQVIGIVLVTAMLIVPAATAMLVSTRLSGVMLLGVGFALAASVAGLHLSFHADVAASSAIVLIACSFFAATLIWTAFRGRPREIREPDGEPARTP